jgi:hypothetical protein
MRVAKDQVICGLAAPDARKLMRIYGDRHPASTAGHLFGIDVKRAAELLTGFENHGYLRPVEAGFEPRETWWVTTVQGGALAQASFGKPIKRATAERHLAGVLERARQFNADPAKLLSVIQLSVFGSYLDPVVEELGDLDLAITYAHRDNGDDFMERVLDCANASGRHFGTFVDQIAWPERELLMFLKNRSPAINITTEDISVFTSRSRVIYRVEDDPAAIKPSPAKPPSPLV